MGSTAISVLRRAFLNLNDVPLGCLIPDPIDPGIDGFPEVPPQFPESEIAKRSILNIRELLGTAAGSGIRAKLHEIFAASVSHRKSATDELIADTATLYHLRHPRSVFQRLYEDTATQEYIKRMNRFTALFLVIGFITVSGAMVLSHANRLAEARAGINVHSGHGISSTGADLEVTRGKERLFSFAAPDERIIGVQYRKVRVVSAGDAAALGETRVLNLLDGKVRGDDPDFMAVADLQESMVVEDLELDSNLKINVEDAEFVFVED